MSAKLEQRADGRLLLVDVDGKLTEGDYQSFAPAIDEAVGKHRRVRMLVDLRGLEGWEPKALWEDLKLDVKHFDSVERLAIVGDQKWHDRMTSFAKPFTTGEVRYFADAQSDEAHQWVEEGLSPVSR